MDKDRSWTVTAVGPKACDSDVHIKDKDELCRLYAMKKPSQLEDPSLTVQVAEMLDAARHITHIHSHFIWRFCLDGTEENVNKMCPLTAGSKEKVLQCPFVGCRSVSKSDAMRAKHILFHHHEQPQPMGIPLDPELAPLAPEPADIEFDVEGCEPIQRPG